MGGREGGRGGTVKRVNDMSYYCHICQSSQRQVYSALSQIAKHSVELAELVVEAEVFPTIYKCLKDPDEYVRKNVATLIREIAKHTPEVSYIWLASQSTFSSVG